MDPLAARVHAFIQHHGLLAEERSAVVGLSGGADSIVLAFLLHQLDVQLTAVHINFGIRGAESDGDEAFVRTWCAERDLDLIVRRFDTPSEADRRGESIQQAARRLRYRAFEEVARSRHRSVVALGHHRDDQAETLLLNLFRGTGIEGLAGMPVRRALGRESGIFVVRPLLCLRRSEIEAYAATQGLSWRDDSSNTSSKYRRGALRTRVLPLLEEVFGEAVTENVARAADLVREYVASYLESELQSVFDEVLRDRAVDLDALSAYDSVIRRRVLLEAARRWLPQTEADATLAEGLDELSALQTGRRLERAGAVIWKERGRLYFAEKGGEASGPEYLVPGAEVRIPSGRLTCELLPQPPDDPSDGAPLQVYLDARHVGPTLTVRPWQSGDRFHPFGMDGEKKVSDFLTDERVPPHEKADVHVVESCGDILWVVPHRSADPSRIRDDTVQTVRLRFVPEENPHPDRS